MTGQLQMIQDAATHLMFLFPQDNQEYSDL